MKFTKDALVHEIQCPNHAYFNVALIAMILFLFLELMNRMYDLYRTNPYVDIPSHFFAGVAFSLLFYWYFTLTPTKRKKSYAFIATFIIAIIWEIMETVEEWIVTNPSYLKDVFFWDGFFDVIFGLLGAFVALALVNNMVHRFHTRSQKWCKV